jgi:predicted glycogen debranching enzyme
MKSTAGCFMESPDWWYGFYHRAEARRQQDDREDLFTPGRFICQFEDITARTCEVTVAASTRPIKKTGIRDGRVTHIQDLQKNVLKTAGLKKASGSPVKTALHRLATASNDFVVRRDVNGEPMSTILAGYPWFADWGRDTMISLPGLLLCTRRFAEARDTLATYARHIRRGLVPNRFDDYGGEPHYNTVDASLWFIHAALEYHRITGDSDTWRGHLADACNQVLTAYEHGTDGGIYMDRDGLIAAGDEHTQLTWMDAKRDGVAFTPRQGKAVEINALWYRALVGCGEAMDGSHKKLAAEYRKLAKRVAASFNNLFWDDARGYLADCHDGQRLDTSLRCNQVLAVSLPDSPLKRKQQQQVMAAARAHLLTPMGLRTLSPEDANYHGHYAGSMFERDGAYHQGTVWAWPMGPYIEGTLRAFKNSADAIKHARAALQPLLDEVAVHSVGQLHEIFEGDAPHRPEGCPAQAWSVAEVLRALILVERADAG